MSKQDYSDLLWKEVMEKVGNLLGSHYPFEPEQLRQMPLICENNVHTESMACDGSGVN